MANFNLSDTVIIIICGAGVALIIAVVLFLILCITSKKKDRVQTIQPTLRRYPRIQEPPAVHPRRLVVPKPPPYSQLPPDYGDWGLYDSVDMEIAENHPTTARGANAAVHRSNSIRTRHGSPYPNTSARSRADSGLYGVQAGVSTNHNRSNRSQVETLAHRDARMNTDSQVPQGYSRHGEYSDNSARNHARNPAIIINSVSATHYPSHAGSSVETNLMSDVLPGEIGFGESPPPSNTAAAIRREQRRQARNTIQSRRLHMSPSPPPAYQQ